MNHTAEALLSIKGLSCLLQSVKRFCSRVFSTHTLTPTKTHLCVGGGDLSSPYPKTRLTSVWLSSPLTQRRDRYVSSERLPFQNR